LASFVSTSDATLAAGVGVTTGVVVTEVGVGVGVTAHVALEASALVVGVVAACGISAPTAGAENQRRRGSDCNHTHPRRFAPFARIHDFPYPLLCDSVPCIGTDLTATQKGGTPTQFGHSLPDRYRNGIIRGTLFRTANADISEQVNPRG
jgi:hypothetical protein